MLWSEEPKDLDILLSERQWREWAKRTPPLGVWAMAYVDADSGEEVSPPQIITLTEEVREAAAFEKECREKRDFASLSYHISQPHTRHWDARAGKFAHDIYGRIDFEQFPGLPQGYGMISPSKDQENVFLVFALVKLHILSAHESRVLFSRIAEAKMETSNPQENGYRWASEALAVVNYRSP